MASVKLGEFTDIDRSVLLNQRLALNSERTDFTLLFFFKFYFPFWVQFGCLFFFVVCLCFCGFLDVGECSQL